MSLSQQSLATIQALLESPEKLQALSGKLNETAEGMAAALQAIAAQAATTGAGVSELKAGQAAILAAIEGLQPGSVTPPDPDPVEPNQPPVVTIIKPAAGAQFNEGQTVQFEALAEDPDGTIAGVNFYLESTPGEFDDLFQEEKVAPYTASLAVNQPGILRVKAVAIDNEGAEAGSEILVITVTAQQTDPVEPDPIPTVDEWEEVEPGLFAMQPTAAELPAGWVSEKVVSGYTSNGYVRWTGGESFSNLPNGGNSGFFMPVRIVTPGVYQLQVRSQPTDLSDPSQDNDTWISVSSLGAPVQAPELFAMKGSEGRVYPPDNPAGSSNVIQGNAASGAALKFYNNSPGSWGMQTTAVDNNPHPIFIEFFEPGLYFLKFDGRSEGHLLDMVFLRSIALDPSVIDSYINPVSGPVTPPVDPDPITPPGQAPSVEIYDNAVAAASSTWFDVKAETVPVGLVTESAAKNLYNTGNAFFGRPERLFCEPIPELGGIKGINVVMPKKYTGYSSRLAIPKDASYPNSRGLAVAMDAAMLKHPKTGNFDQDRRGYLGEYHWKGCGAQTILGAPEDCNGGQGNPVKEPRNCEFVLMSMYGPDMAKHNNGFGAKGDELGASLPQGFTQWDRAGNYGPAIDFEAADFLEERFLWMVAIYAADVTQYKCQSQIYPVYPMPDGSLSNVRWLPHKNRLYRMRFLIAGNTFTPVRFDSNGNPIEYASNNDGEFAWVIQCDQENNGQPWIAAHLRGRNFTIGNSAQFAEHGIGAYINPSSVHPAFDNGYWIINHTAHGIG